MNDVGAADFVAMDLEMTGVTSAPWGESFEFDRLDVRYLKAKDSDENFSFNPNPYLAHRYSLLPLRPQSLNLSIGCSSSSDNNKITYPPSPQPSPPEKKSFAIATGELFLGIASRLLKSGKGNKNGSFSSFGVSLFEKLNGNGNARVKDIKAEKERRVITSPGFSFSAAGLLFPYHLGVAQLLIEKGYIKVSFLSSDYRLIRPRSRKVTSI
uniref:Uncharacterized protein n=1 Tax=Manihot esculenta TaxID=3983 RepID=A0A2C9VB30_MANES